MSEAKPRACPACGSTDVEVDYDYHDAQQVHCQNCNLSNLGGNAIAAWNGIRARVLREAAVLFKALYEPELPDSASDYDRGWEAGAYEARETLLRAAARAERGEP